MHSMGIVHRDLKPENILCARPNSIQQIKIADFGISKVIFDPETRRKEKEEKKRAKKQKQKQLRTLQQRAQELYESQFHDDEFKVNAKNPQYLNGMMDDEKSSAQNTPHTPNSASNTPYSSQPHTPQHGPSKRHHKKSKKKKRSKPFVHPLKKKHKGDHGGGQRPRKHRMSSTYMDAKYDLMNTMCGTIRYVIIYTERCISYFLYVCLLKIK